VIENISGKRSNQSTVSEQWTSRQKIQMVEWSI